MVAAQEQADILLQMNLILSADLAQLAVVEAVQDPHRGLQQAVQVLSVLDLLEDLEILPALNPKVVAVVALAV